MSPTTAQIGYEKVCNGDYFGAFNQMTENAMELPILLGGLIPGDFTTDFIAPIGMIKGSGKILKVTEGFTIKVQASEISKFIGKNRITMPEGTLDLMGRSHGGSRNSTF